jgi:tellurite resistance-related uncharacterized protein
MARPAPARLDIEAEPQFESEPLVGPQPQGSPRTRPTHPITDPIPAHYQLTRTTPTFDNDTVPTGLLAAHCVADGGWGRLVIYTGQVDFVFEDEPGQSITATAGDHVVIPPGRPHNLELIDPVTFAVEFHRDPADDQGYGTIVSTGLQPPASTTPGSCRGTRNTP